MSTSFHAGGIHLARPTPGGRAALVLITAHHQVDQLYAVTLLSPDIELGTSLDLVLQPDTTGLPYRVLAESDIFDYLPAGQLGHPLGHVDRQVLDALTALRNDDCVDLPVAGPPAWTRTDSRWKFKLAELHRMRQLQSS